MLELLTAMVERESVTREKAKVDILVDLMEARLNALRADCVERFLQVEVGDFLQATWNRAAPGKPYLFLVHIDTVHPVGSLKTMPIKVEDGRFYGPGALDMKAGVVIVLEAIGALADRKRLPNRPIHLLMTTDEEIGSPYSEALIKELADGCELVLVTEPATQEGTIKTWRKGGGKYELLVEGRASHAGIAPQEGIKRHHRVRAASLGHQPPERSQVRHVGVDHHGRRRLGRQCDSSTGACAYRYTCADHGSHAKSA